MPIFSMSSMEKLKTCHEDLQTIFLTVVGLRDCTVAVGHRSKKEQDQAVADGRSKNPWPSSKHNTDPSLAADVYPNPMPQWSDMSDFIYFAGFVEGVANLLYQQGLIRHKLRSGLDWNKNNSLEDEHGLRDAGHFELYLPKE